MMSQTGEGVTYFVLRAFYEHFCISDLVSIPYKIFLISEEFFGAFVELFSCFFVRVFKNMWLLDKLPSTDSLQKFSSCPRMF